MFRAISLATFFLLVASLVSNESHGDVLVVSPDRDNTLYQRDAGDLSNGAGEHLFFGLTGGNANNVLRRALMRFDLSSIPPGSTINNVELTFEVDLVPPTATGYDATLHRVLADWGEGASVAQGAGGAGAPAQAPDATWLHREFDTVLWTTPGGDFDATVSASAAVGSGTGPVVIPGTPTLMADVEAWVNDPASNFGWILRGDENSPQNARRIGSRENPTIAPQLVVDFEPLLLPEARPVPTLNAWGVAILLIAVFVVGLRLRHR